MIHISRFVQPPNPNSAVPPSPSDRQPPHAARNGGGSRIPAHCRSRGGAVRKSAVRCGPKAIVPDRPATPNRLATRALPRRSPRYGLPENSPPPKKTGPHTRDLSETSSPKRDIAQNEVPEKRILPAESSTGRPPPKNEVFPRRTLRTRLSQNELPPRTASETKPFETGQSARMQRFAVPSSPLSRPDTLPGNRSPRCGRARMRSALHADRRPHANCGRTASAQKSPPSA